MIYCIGLHKRLPPPERICVLNTNSSIIVIDNKMQSAYLIAALFSRNYLQYMNASPLDCVCVCVYVYGIVATQYNR